MRPWVGLFGFGLVSWESALGTRDGLHLLLRNFGALPAQRASLQLTIRPLKWEDNEPDNSIRWQERGVKALVPGEEGDYRVEVSNFSQWIAWRDARRDLGVEGAFTYWLDQASFTTKFEAKLQFSTCAKSEDHNLRPSWRNLEVI
jgi:hypothetical protein